MHCQRNLRMKANWHPYLRVKANWQRNLRVEPNWTGSLICGSNLTDSLICGLKQTRRLFWVANRFAAARGKLRGSGSGKDLGVRWGGSKSVGFKTPFTPDRQDEGLKTRATKVINALFAKPS